MKLNKEDLLLYGVTDSKYLKGRKMSELVEEAILGGVTMIQLREKEMTHESFKQEALDVQSVCQKHHVPLIINDDVELCKEIDADGVHIGQDDLNLKEARKILGEDKIIGVSAHNYEEAKIALENGADYLGVGAIFATQTKDDAQNISMETLNEICQKVDIPVVAIGGINQVNILEFMGVAIDGVAIVSSIFGSNDIQKASSLLKDKIRRVISNKMPTCLTIAGSDSSGGAGIQADLKTMLANRVYAMSVIAALTAQNTTGVDTIYDVDASFVASQMDSVFTDIYPMAVKIGMVSQKEVILSISGKLKQYHARNIVVDPVMVATSGAKLISDEAIDTLKENLFPLASVLTPNIPEAEVLSGLKINNEEEMLTAAKYIGDHYHCAVLLKGGHQINDANDLLYKEGNYQWFKGKRINNNNTHGTGCTLSSAIASHLARGENLENAVKKAKDYISGALAAMLDLGQGQGPMDHGYVLDKKDIEVNDRELSGPFFHQLQYLGREYVDSAKGVLVVLIRVKIGIVRFYLAGLMITPTTQSILLIK